MNVTKVLLSLPLYNNIIYFISRIVFAHIKNFSVLIIMLSSSMFVIHASGMEHTPFSFHHHSDNCEALHSILCFSQCITTKARNIAPSPGDEAESPISEGAMLVRYSGFSRIKCPRENAIKVHSLFTI